MRGDLSNEVTPRLIFVFEDVIAMPPSAKHWTWGRRISDYELNDELVALLWRVVARLGVRFDVATFLPPKAVPFIRDYLESANVPISNVRPYASPQALAGALSSMPDVIGVYDLPDRAVAYGGKGQDIADLGRLL